MAKKILYIVIGALVIAALIALLWLWLAPERQSDTDYGNFGAAGERTGGEGVGVGSATNLGSSLSDSSSVRRSRGDGSSDSSTSGSGQGGVSAGISGGSTNVISGGRSSTLSGGGATWVGGGTSASLSGSGRVFTPSEINQLNGASGALPNIASTLSSTQSGGLGLGTALLGAGIAGAVSCASFLLPTNLLSSNPIYVKTSAPEDNQKKILDCLTRVIARAALDQITRSIVTWINSGFNGKPSFVQNYNQFFTNIADQAAGEFIRGSGLAFLCSPFRPQVRIAIAQAYANRNAQSCSLTSIIRNTNSFMNGNFSAGGWPGFLAFTTVPSNNPFGAFNQSQINLGNYQANKVLEQQMRLQQGQGFLPVTKQQNCTPTPIPGTQGGVAYNCKEVIVTPGRTVADAVGKVTGNSIDTLNLAKNFDEILNALISQLLVRTLYQGLGGSPNTVGADLAQQATMNQAQGLLATLQGAVSTAQQYGSVKQGTIRDIQLVQQNYNTLYNCWSTKLPQSSATAAGATAAQATIDSLEARIGIINADITRANSVISALQELQTELALATNAAGVAAVKSSFDAAHANGSFITQSEVTTAQQDRSTLQSEMTSLNTQANTALSQCRSS